MVAKARPIGSMVMWADTAPAPASYTPSKSFQLRVGHFWLDTSKTPNGLYVCTNSSPTGTVWVRLTDLAEGGENMNIMFGGAGNETFTGEKVILLGPGAGAAVASGDNNIAIGESAGSLNSSGSNWQAIGPGAGRDNVSGSFWQALGYEAGAVCTTSEFQAIGTSAGVSNISGETWQAVGYNAAAANTSGSRFSSVGHHSGASSTTGDEWTALGVYSAKTVTTGSYFVSVGYGSGVATGGGAFSDWIAIGHGAEATASGQLALGSFGHPLNTHATAGAIVEYLEINLNGTVRKIPVHAVS